MHILSLLCVLVLVCWSKQEDMVPKIKKPPAQLKDCKDRPWANTTRGPICGVHCPDGDDPENVCGMKFVPSVNGTMKNVVPIENTINYTAYSGIPFTEPPLGKLRFKVPVPLLKPWKDIRDGGWMTPKCPQLDIWKLLKGIVKYVGQEDCLFLNVYVPEVKKSKTGFPVMVWIHGGAFSYGGINEFFADKLMTREVILVSIQYRLGILGFLSTEDDVAPGNLGLKDQLLALKWIQDNIANFGGDQSKVTIFGESAGSISVHLHMLNPQPQAKGLFSRAIMQSGTALMPMDPKFNHKQKAFEVASKLNCSVQKCGNVYNSTELIKCLQKDNLHPKSFIGVVNQFIKWGTHPIPFSLRVGDDLIPGPPEQLLRDGKYNMVDIIMGINQNEGGLWKELMFNPGNNMKALANNFSQFGHHVFGMNGEQNEVAKQILQHYLGGIREYKKEDDAALVSEMFGDFMFNIPHDNSLALHSRDALYGKNVYAYELKHKPEVKHGDDVKYLFKQYPYYLNVSLRLDLRLENTMLNLWTNFAKYGNPTPDRTLGFTWDPVTLESTDHLVLKTEPYMEADTRCQNRKFMSSLDISINQVLFPDRIGQGSNWKPWNLQDQRTC